MSRRRGKSIFGVLALLLLIIAGFIKLHADGSAWLQLFSDVIKDVAIVAGSLVILDYLWSATGGDPAAEERRELRRLIRLGEAGARTGLFDAYSTVRESGLNHVSLIADSQRCIEFVAYNLHDVAESTSILAALAARAEAGVTVRILMPDEAGASFRHTVAPANINGMIALVEHTLGRLHDVYKKLSPAAKAHFLVRLMRPGAGVIDVSLRRYDDVVSVAPYLYGVQTPDTPLFIFSDGPVAKRYIDWFGQMFDGGERAWPE